MSHFTTVKTVIRDQETLRETLQQLHYNFQVGERLPIRGYADSRQYGQVVINTGSKYDIGFQRQADGAFNVCADWWGVQGNTPIREQSFLQQVNQTYAAPDCAKTGPARGLHHRGRTGAGERRDRTGGLRELLIESGATTMKKMHIRIKTNGKTEIRVEGGQGDDCLAFTRSVEQALGAVDTRKLCAEDTDPLRVDAREQITETEGF